MQITVSTPAARCAATHNLLRRTGDQSGLDELQTIVFVHFWPKLASKRNISYFDERSIRGPARVPKSTSKSLQIFESIRTEYCARDIDFDKMQILM
ncbi:hypothetical protein [Altererythrobacter fulvus]|uniref:hypothetical protein n=1 Tax=Caenibius fulvus TaxID=2126012 RepID=UPI00301A921C